MTSFLLWLILLAISWPLALLGLLLYPIIWLMLLPLRLIGIAISGVLAVLEAVIRLPARIFGAR